MLPATPIISVIVATRNRRESLRRFLDGLRGLPHRPDWELVIIDNGSTDGTDVLLAAAAVDLPALIVEEKQPGKSRALNAALKRARGEILLFTDDDVIPDRNWLVALHKASSEYPTANIFGGRILVDYDQIPRWIATSSNLKTILVSEQDFGDETCWFGRDQYPIGPNLAVRRRTLERSSFGWPINLGPGTRVPVGDERAFLVRLSPADACDRLYVPGSVVRHHIHGRELSIGSALSRCFLGGYAAGIIGGLREREDAGAEPHALRAARQRLGALSNGREFVCIVARALGVIAGSVTPFGRVLYS